MEPIDIQHLFHLGLARETTRLKWGGIMHGRLPKTSKVTKRPTLVVMMMIAMIWNGRLASAFDDHRVRLEFEDGAEWVGNAVRKQKTFLRCRSQIVIDL